MNQLRLLLDKREKEIIFKLQNNKQAYQANLVKEKIKLEDFKVKENFPLKIFEILEEKFKSKEMSLNLLLI